MQKSLAGADPKAIRDIRSQFNAATAATGAYSVEAVKAKSATQLFTESLSKSDLKISQARKSFQMFNQVLQEQHQLQKMTAVQWSKNASGMVTADMIVPRGVDERLQRLTGSLRSNLAEIKSAKAAYSAAAAGTDEASAASARLSEAQNVLRMRAGLANQIMGSFGSNMIKWGKNTQWAGRQLMVGFTVPFAAFAAIAGAAAYNVDKELTRIAKVYDTTTNSMLSSEAQATQKAQELGRVRRQSMLMAGEAAQLYGASVKDTLSVEAELAATGMKGANLMKNTSEVVRVATLGEMDYADATKMSIALQKAFRLSTEDTTKAMNFMNSIENATSLSLQDFAEATPRAASALSSLGVTVQQMGILLVAMKEHGVDAAEGANALKSATTRLLRPTADAVKRFQALGINIGQITTEAGGNLFKVLDELGQKLKGVDASATEKQSAIAALFGTYQFNRLNAALTGITEKTGQVGAAFAVANQDAQQWADTAANEVTTAANSISGRFKRAVESIKFEISQIGAAFLPIATAVIGGVAGILKAFNNMGTGFKTAIVGVMLFGAAAGVLVMFTGLLANMIGTIVKVSSSLAGMGIRFKALTPEQRVQEMLAKQTSIMWNNQGMAAKALSGQLQYLAKNLEMVAVAQAQAQGSHINGFGDPTEVQGPAAGPPLKQDANGKWRRANGQMAGRGEVAAHLAAQRAATEAAQAARVQEQTSTVAKRNWLGIAGGATAAAASIGLMTVGMDHASGETSSILSDLTQMVLVGSMVGPALAKSLSGSGVGAALSNVQGVYSASRYMGAGVGGALKTAIPTALSLGAAIAKFAGPAGLLATAVYSIYKIAKAFKDAKTAQDQLSGSAKQWAEVLGFTYQEVGATAAGDSKNRVSQATRAKQFADANKEVAASLREATTEQDKLNLAIAEGVKVRMHGGSAEQAAQAVRTSLQVAGVRDEMTLDNLMVKVKAKVDFGNIEDVMRQQLEDIAKKLTTVVEVDIKPKTNWESIGRWFDNKALSGAGQEAAKNLADEFWNTMSSLNPQAQKAYYDKLSAQMNQMQQTAMSSLSKYTSDALSKAGIKSASAAIAEINRQRGQVEISGPANNPLAAVSDDDLNKLQRAVQTEREFAQEWARQAGLAPNVIAGINTIQDARVRLGVATRTYNDAQNQYTAEVQKAESSGKKLSDQEKLLILNKWRAAAGLGAASAATTGFDDVLNTNTASLQKNTAAQQQSIMSQQEWADAWTSATKDAMSGAQSDVLGYADDIRQKADQAALDAINKRADADAKAVDAAAARTDARFDAREKKMEHRYDDLGDKLDDKQKARRKSVEAGYDSQIKAINDGIKAKQRAVDAEDRSIKAAERGIEVTQKGIDASQRGIDATQKGIDATERSIELQQKAIDAEERAEEKRQKIYEAEKTRIERMSQMANRSIDYNMALNTGQLDEAAKIFNDIQAQQGTWSMDDATANSGGDIDKQKEALQRRQDQVEARKSALQRRQDQVEARKNALQNRQDDVDARKRTQQMHQDALDRAKEAADAQIESVNKQRDVALANLDKVDREEKKALDRKKDRNKEALASARKTASQESEAQKERIKRDADRDGTALKNEQERRKRTLDIELAAIRASVPKNKAQYDAQIKQIEGAYNQYGIRLKTKGSNWGKYVGTYLSSNVANAAKSLQNDINWKGYAKKISDDFMSGAFGMSVSEFGKWIMTGKAPNDAFHQGSNAPNDAKSRAKGASNKAKASAKDKGRSGMLGSAHGGGEVTHGKRTGVPNSASRYPSEVDYRLKVGEYVVKKNAVNKYGKKTMDDINEGRADIGGGDVGLSGVLMGGLAGTLRNMMMMGTAVAATRKMAEVNAEAPITDDISGFSGKAGKAGKYGGSFFNASQLKNAATIMSVGKSMGGSARDILIGLMTAMQESTLTNVNYGDTAGPDSRGLFQQRNSWGSLAERMNPAIASKLFFRELFKVKNRDNMQLSLAAQAVQRSRYPYAYAKWEDEARAIMGSTKLTASNTATSAAASQPGSTNQGLWGMLAGLAGANPGQAASGVPAALTGGDGKVKGGWRKPLDHYRVSSPFGYRIHPITGVRKLHNGIDLAAPAGTPIHAAQGGRVAFSGVNGGYGNYTVIAHPNGLFSGYGHQLRPDKVDVGSKVSKGQVFGVVGSTGASTGNHLHFQIGRSMHNWENPRNYMPQLKNGGVTLSDGIAKLHKDETVLTAPLSEKLNFGIDKIANGGTTQYNVSLDLRGAVIRDNVDFKAMVYEAIDEKEFKMGRSRKIGGGK